MKKKTVYVIVGPTASGKTALSVALSKKLSGEIVSADSMQIYKNMDIATAKPDEKEKQGVAHHLMDFLSPGESFSVAAYKEAALEKIREIFERGNQPIVVGGTGLYIDTLVNNTVFFDFETAPVRKELSDRLQKNGLEALYGELEKVDRQAFEKIHPKDEKRILRALEVYYATGKTISEQAELSHLEESCYNWVIIGLRSENRQYLYDRINLRVELMLQQGLVEEAKNFFARSVSVTAKQAIGYKELKPWLDGLMSFEEAVESLKRETRRYAKRQLTWFKKNPSIHWLEIEGKDKDELLSEALNIIEQNR